MLQMISHAPPGSKQRAEEEQGKKAPMELVLDERNWDQKKEYIGPQLTKTFLILYEHVNKWTEESLRV